jgi:hypothetical protein
MGFSDENAKSVNSVYIYPIPVSIVSIQEVVNPAAHAMASARAYNQSNSL